ncbi:DUF1361 domain-containing protein [Macrococcus brunensis]|uniref:DUF1361 domain-containing protein n=2 Tax=Macrococcus brunensis TaxID=198483 RepID=A0A4R6BF01_9STAP|nr:DUF1361 domain-containing protein [Macrococcus brunensis]TDL98417.1 DUF1361 domain-containing protein [Macrococcus brunensis]
MYSRNIGRLCFVLYLLISFLIPTQYLFMVQNLILAFIPYEISQLLPLFKPKSRREWPLFLVVSLVFVLMSPNIFYVVTDLIHLNLYSFDFLKTLNLSEWIDFTYLSAGVMLALYYYVQVILTLYHLVSDRLLQRVVILMFMILSSAGIFIGRFLRFHSVHILTNPLQVIVDSLSALNSEAILWMALITGLQFLLMLLVKGVRKI